MEDKERAVHIFTESSCSVCNACLCVRQQVINLALGYTENMSCLKCLGKENAQLPEDILSGVKGYILGRECFAKPWKRYLNVQYCPNPDGCLPSLCFEQ